jgi:hypothetical protein
LTGSTGLAVIATASAVGGMTGNVVADIISQKLFSNKDNSINWNQTITKG